MKDIAPSYHDNPSQRTPCVVVLDASESMGHPAEGSGRRRIDELNDGLAELERELKQDKTARYRVQLAVVCVGGPAREAGVLVDWTDAKDFQAPKLQCGGLTPLGAGVALALQIVEEQKADLRANGVGYTRPWVIVMSDGEPTDAEVWVNACRQSKAAEADRKCVVYPLAVKGANIGQLQQVSEHPVAELSQAKFREYFQWLSSSLASLSRSRPGTDVQLPATDPWTLVASQGIWNSTTA